MTREPTIRRAVLADAEAIGDLHARSWQSAYRGILPDEVLDAITVEQGYREMTMWVLVGNERAQRFYGKAGFVPDERISPEVFGETGALKMRMWRGLD